MCYFAHFESFKRMKTPDKGKADQQLPLNDSNYIMANKDTMKRMDAKRERSRNHLAEFLS